MDPVRRECIGVDDDARTSSSGGLGVERGRRRRGRLSAAWKWLLFACAACALGTTNAGVEMLEPADWGVWPSSQLNQNNLTVTVRGSAFFSTNLSACRVGDFVVPLAHVSSEEVRCTVAPSLRLRKGFSYVEVSMNGLDFTSDRITFNLHEPVKLEQVFPYGWDKGGGGVLRLSGLNFAPGSSKCAFGAGGTGTVAAVSDLAPSEVVSSAFMKCETPAFSSLGMTDVSVRSWSDSGSLSGSRAFEVWQEPTTIEIAATWNMSHAAQGGVAIVLQGFGNEELVEPTNMFGYSCHFGTITVSAVMDTLTVNRTVTCKSPALHHTNSTVDLWIGPNIDSFKPNTSVTFTYPDIESESVEVPGDETTVVYTGSEIAVVPTYVLAPGGSVISVTGTSLSTASSCRVGTDTTAIVRFISSSYIQCEISPGSEGGAYLFTSGDSSVHSTNIHFVPVMELSSTAPVYGGLEGGTSVQLTGSNFEHSSDLACLFGSVSVLATHYSTTQIDCVSPAHAKAVVSMGVGRRDLASHSFISETSYVYNSSNMLAAVMPSVVRNVGSTSLTLVWSQLYAESTGCRVDGILLDPCTVTGSTSPGFVEVFSYTFATDTFVSEPAEFAYYVSPVVSGSIPVVIQNFIPTVVYMLGSDFVNEANVLCAFDDTAVDATFVSSALVKCTSHLVGTLGNKDAQVGFGSASAEGVWSRTEMSLSAVDILNMTSISPTRGVLTGGTVITVTGEGFEGVGSVYCRVGTISYIQSRVIRDEVVECTSPTYFDATVDVQVHILGNVYANTAQSFVYTSGVELVAVLPPASPLGGNSDILIFGLDGEAGESYNCVIGGSVVASTFARFGELPCVSPASSEGFTAVGIGAIIDDMFDQQVIEYVRSPIMRSIYPFNGPTSGGTLIHIVGEHLRDSAHLSLESTISSSHFLSSALVVSELPASTAAVHNARVSMNGKLVSHALTFTSRDAITLSNLSLVGIADSGGSVIDVTGSNMPNDLSLLCSFGSIQVSAQWSLSTAATCVSPSHMVDTSTEFRVHADRFASATSIVVFYVSESAITDALPPSLSAAELPTQVTIYGEWLASASCDGVALPLNTSWASSFSCTIDPVSVGYASVSVISRGLTTSIAYMIKETPSLMSVSPPGASDLPGEIFTVSTRHMIGDGEQFHCLYDSTDAVEPEIVSSALIRCESIATAKLSTSFTIEGGNGVIALSRQAAPVATSISPSTSGDIGGTLISISGTSIPIIDASAVCSFGTIGPVTPQSTTSLMVRCMSPAGVADETVPVCVSVYGVLSPSRSCANASITFIAPVDAPLVLDHGVSSKDGGYFYLWRSAASYARISVLSTVDLGLGTATVSSTLASVYISPRAAGGFTPVSTIPEIGGLSFDQLMVQPTPLILGANPKFFTDAGGSQVWVSGYDLGSEQLRVSVDDETTAFIIVSSALMVIEVPDHALGRSFLKAGLGSRTDSNGIGIGPFSSVGLDYVVGISLTKISPTLGPDAGTSPKVSITGAGFSDGSPLGCKFGTIGPTSVLYVHEREIKCAAPGHALGEVPVQISTNGRDYTSGLTYTYVYAPSHFDSISPAIWPTHVPSTTTLYGKGMDSQMENLCGPFNTSTRGLSTDTSTVCSWVATTVAGFVQVGYHTTEAYVKYNPDQTQFEYYEPLTVTNLEPFEGPVDGGTVLFMSGSNFRNDDGNVMFGTVTVVSHFVSSSLRIIVSPMFSTTGLQTLYASTQKTALTAFSAVDELSLSSVSPALSTIDGGQDLVVIGDNFSAPAAVWCRAGAIGPLLAYPTDAKSLRCTSPAHMKESGVHLQVSMNKRDWRYELTPSLTDPSAAAGSSYDSILTIDYVLPAKIWRVLPSAGHVTDSSASIEAFYDVPYPVQGATARGCFNGRDVSTSSDTSGLYSILCTLGQDAFIQGMHAIITSGPDAANTSFTGIFQYSTAPTIDAFEPEVIHTGGGTLVSIFLADAIESGIACMFSTWTQNSFSGRVVVDAHFISSSLIVCESPYAAPLTKVGLSAGLHGTTPENARVELESVSRPLITHVDPNNLFLDGGTAIGITGTDFGLQVQDLYGSVGTISPLSLRWLTADKVEAISPATYSGDKAVLLSHHLSARSEVYGTLMTFFKPFEPSPLIPDVVPARANAFVRLHALIGFLQSSVPSCNPADPKFSLCQEAINIGAIFTKTQPPNFAILEIPDTQLTVNVPQLAYVESSSPTAVQPSISVTGGGTVAVVAGSNFVDGMTFVRVGDVAHAIPHASHSFVSSTLIRFEVPAGVNARRDSVYTSNAFADSESWVNSGDYTTFYNLPTLVASSQPLVFVESGGAQVEIQGTGFQANRDLYCKFGEVHIKATYLSSISLECISPAMQVTSFPVRVSNNMLDYSRYVNVAANAGSDDDVSVHVVGDFVNAVDTVNGEYGPTTGGTLFSVSFSSTPPAVISCKFASRLGTGFISDFPANTAKCVTPPSDAGFVPVLLASSLSAGALYSSTATQFEFLAAPEIDMVFPEMGFLGGGTLLNVHGDNLIQSLSVAAHGSPLMPGTLIEGLSCRFGGIYTVAAVHVSSTIMRCESPAFATSLVEVPLVIDLSVNALDWVGSQIAFEPIADAMISYLSPLAGSRAGGTTVTIAGGYFTPNAPVWCKFGATGPIHALFNGDGSVRCMSPAKYQGDIPVAISRGNANDFAFTTSTIFKM
ncbi:Immunoglobulin-like fold [Ostreococcus tauri]|uniref:Immunoglobulin-like fold n=1 Tax=Ostreococcus tauri TaxID=70448 RepID=A0A090M1J9_OSTTA|nr:Immunoglobulin-like fold [Ostreococcus tauri]CEF98066.1 Immunoglobulin-like fold [Ostreococcus tauri]|eukprot:XP_022839060.1 Immunoglobulin-like fold [Ostreococcus tauri]